VRSRIDEPVEPEIVEALTRHFPDFRRAYLEDGLSVEEFDTYVPTVRTLRQLIAASADLEALVRDAPLPDPGQARIDSATTVARPCRTTRIARVHTLARRDGGDDHDRRDVSLHTEQAADLAVCDIALLAGNRELLRERVRDRPRGRKPDHRQDRPDDNDQVAVAKRPVRPAAERSHPRSLPPLRRPSVGQGIARLGRQVAQPVVVLVAADLTARVSLGQDRPGVRPAIAATRPRAAAATPEEGAHDRKEDEEIGREQRPDVVLMDVRMPVMDGIEATRRLATQDAESPRVLILTTFDLDEHVYDALSAGASGFLLKTLTAEKLFDAVRTVAAGDALLAPTVTRRFISEFARLRPRQPTRPEQLRALTPRETEVLILVAEGLSNSEIAARLVVADETVKTHVSSILSKLDLSDRVQAVVAAYESGLVRAHPER
jgi:DNA-binding NarL/FixJ family response regulator